MDRGLVDSTVNVREASRVGASHHARHYVRAASVVMYVVVISLTHSQACMRLVVQRWRWWVVIL